MTVVLLVTNNASLNLSIYIGIIGDITDEKGFCRRACVLRRRVDVVSLALFRNGRNHASIQNWRHQNFTAFKSRFVRSSWFFQTLWMSCIWVAGRNGKSIALKAWARSSWWMGEKVGNDGGVMDEAHEMNSLFAFSFRIESCRHVTSQSGTKCQDLRLHSIMIHSTVGEMALNILSWP